MTSATPALATPAVIDWPAIKRVAIEAFVDLMPTVPNPIRTESALELCRHVDGVKEVYATAARPIIAEAVEVVGAYLKGLEKSTAVH